MSKQLFDWLFKGVVISSLIVLIAVQFKNRDEIVYVDAAKLMNGYKGMEAAKKEFVSRTEGLRANLDTLRMELDEKINEYETRESKLNSKERELMEEVIETKREQFINYQKIVSEKIQQEDQQLTMAVLEKVNAFIKKYGAEKQYEIILAATQQGNIVYAKDGKDITEQVLEGLNKEFVK